MRQPLTDIIDLFMATKKTEGLAKKTTDGCDWILRQFLSTALATRYRRIT